MRTLRIGFVGAVFLLASACTMHVIDIQQGTIITPEMVGQLKPGMSRSQVKFVMGTPTVADPFRHDRWDYIYTLRQKGKKLERRHLALHFEGEQLVRIDDEQAGSPPAEGQPQADPSLSPAPGR
jgi:outer membrane protein assembly factor BamE